VLGVVDPWAVRSTVSGLLNAVAPNVLGPELNAFVVLAAAVQLGCATSTTPWPVHSTYVLKLVSGLLDFSTVERPRGTEVIGPIDEDRGELVLTHYLGGQPFTVYQFLAALMD
jgi:hypothetical protein